MILKYKREKEYLTVELDGELDHHSAEKVRDELDKHLEDISIKCLVLDLKNLKFMDSSGIGVVLGRYKTITRRHGIIKIVNANSHIDKIFEVSGLYKIVQKQ